LGIPEKLTQMTTFSPNKADHRFGARHRFEGMVLTEHFFTLPLDYAAPQGEKIEVFVREVVSADFEHTSHLPPLVFFQGGPGFGSPRPMGKSGMMGHLLKHYRVFLLDQRGTGRSTKMMPETLLQRGSASEQAAYATHFRADSIVRDAESIRKLLIGEQTPWCSLGQSYGGFILLTYLSLHPEGLRKVFITGGVACVKRRIEENYRLTYGRVRQKNALYYTRYPEDEARVQHILTLLLEKPPTLSNGSKLTPRRFQQLGLNFGMSGGFESLHYLLEEAYMAGSDSKLSQAFLLAVERQLPFESNPIFCILHESIYAEGYATNWAAERLREEFSWVKQLPDQRMHFTGEMISPCMLEDYPSLRPLRDCAQLLAEKSDWGALYDLNNLAKNTIPVAAISYQADMYVPIEWSIETADHIPNCHLWITNEWEHNGLGIDGPKILARLQQMLEG
jgi:pimeloyl-ACP methyl ester carboxylesterase